MAGLTWQRGQGGQGSPGWAMLWTGPLPLLLGLLLQPGPGWFQFSLLGKQAARPVIRCVSPGGGEVSDFASRQGHAYQKAGGKLYPRLGWSHRPSPVSITKRNKGP